MPWGDSWVAEGPCCRRDGGDPWPCPREQDVTSESSTVTAGGGSRNRLCQEKEHWHQPSDGGRKSTAPDN